MVPEQSDVVGEPERQVLLIQLGKKLRPQVDRLAAASSKLPDAPILDQATLPWTALLRDNWATIRDEAREILSRPARVPTLDAVSPDHKGIGAGGKWKSFFLHGYGTRVDANCLQAPRTAGLLAEVPDLNTAFFSILDPGAHIAQHRGVTKGLLTWHLGLETPDRAAACRMTVGDETVHWRAGESFLFDDTYRHEVWNDTDQRRVILLVQVRRPMAWPLSIGPDLFLWGVRHSPFVKDAIRNIENWDSAYRRTEAEGG